MLTGLIAFYVMFVVIRDGDRVAYRLWSFYHDYLLKPYKGRRGWLIQYASNSDAPFRWMRKV